MTPRTGPRLQVATSPAGTTYQLGLTLTGDAKTVYSIYGDNPDDLTMPPAFQTLGADGQPSALGSNIGGVSAELLAINPDLAYDSWLTVGLGVDGANIGTIGLDFDSWTSSTGTPRGSHSHPASRSRNSTPLHKLFVSTEGILGLVEDSRGGAGV